MTYSLGNTELLELIRKEPFDKERAEKIVSGIKDIDEIITDEKSGYKGTYLNEAVEYENIEAVKLLLEYGADPNFDDAENWICPLTSLRYIWWTMNEDAEDIEKIAKKRYEISKLFFDYGADPNFMFDDESLYEDVLSDVFNDEHDELWKYELEFLKLLIAYGGKSGQRPALYEPVDRSRIDDYRIKLEQCEDGYHMKGLLYDPSGRIIGEL